MSRLYLITGFLGAGKTTFLKQFMKQFSSERMHIIVNEFGKEGIDGELLSIVGCRFADFCIAQCTDKVKCSAQSDHTGTEGAT